jgi:hypothetical protein
VNTVLRDLGARLPRVDQASCKSSSPNLVDGLLSVTKASADALLQPKVYEDIDQHVLKSTHDDTLRTD